MKVADELLNRSLIFLLFFSHVLTIFMHLDFLSKVKLGASITAGAVVTAVVIYVVNALRKVLGEFGKYLPGVALAGLIAIVAYLIVS